MIDEKEHLTEAGMAYIISRVVDNAKDAAKEARKDRKNSFEQGRVLAYYEVLNTMKNDLIGHCQDLKEYGLDFNLEKEIS